MDIVGVIDLERAADRGGERHKIDAAAGAVGDELGRAGSCRRWNECVHRRLPSAAAVAHKPRWLASTLGQQLSQAGWLRPLLFDVNSETLRMPALSAPVRCAKSCRR